MDFAPDFPAILLEQEHVKKLNMLLSPANSLHRDVRSISGSLGFATDEVTYIFQKQYPFVYMLDQWIKREREEATLKKMYCVLLDLRRLDAAEIVEEAVKELARCDPKELMHSLAQQFNQLQRASSTSTLCAVPKPDEEIQPMFEHHQHQSEKTDVKPPLRNASSDAPDVFTVYFPDNEKHLRNIRCLIKKLRKNGVNATVDMFEATASSADRGFYIYSRLIKAEYVFVICSPLFMESYEHEINKTGDGASGKVKEVSFIMKLILDDIYDKAGVNAKYIPILLPKCTEEHVPMLLRSATIYKMPVDYDDLKRRIFKIEKYKLAPMPAKKPDLKPKVISISR